MYSSFLFLSRKQHSQDCRLNAFNFLPLCCCRPSGCGKSTTVALMERFYDPQSGVVLLDGIDIRKMDVTWLRSQMGLVNSNQVLGWAETETFYYSAERYRSRVELNGLTGFPRASSLRLVHSREHPHREWHSGSDYWRNDRRCFKAKQCIRFHHGNICCCCALPLFLLSATPLLWTFYT